MSSIATMVLLTDGTVMMETFDDIDTWVKLTPDAKGSYVNGTWTTLAKMRTPRLYFASQVMQNGKLWVMGGEYTGPFEDANWGPEAEIYDPLTNRWSNAATYPPEKDCGNQPITSNAQLTAGSRLINGIYSTTRLLRGFSVSGTSGIPANAKVVRASGHQVVMNAPATATGASIVQFSGNVESCFGDDPSILLPRHNILVGNLNFPTTFLYSIDTNSFVETGTKVYNDQSDEEGWAKLRDGSVLNYDLWQSVFTGTGYAEKYDPSSGVWSSASPADGTANGTLPVLSSVPLGFELGPILRLQDGRVVVIGANQLTALYSPESNRWAPGPDMLANLTGPGGTIKNAKFGADDASAAILPSGHVILTADAGPNPVTLNGKTRKASSTITLPSTAGLQPGWSVGQADGGNSTIPPGSVIFKVDSSHTISLGTRGGGKIDALESHASIGLVFGGVFSPPTQVFDFDPKAGTMTPIQGPGSSLPGESSYVTHMLILPTGELLFSDGSNQLYVYKADGFVPFHLLPEIESVRFDHQENIFTLTGTQLNGQSAGAAYGDDAQMDENYPIVRLTDPFTGNVFYCRTTNWSSTGVGKGNDHEPETVNFTLNPKVTPGSYTLTVTGAGLQSFPTRIFITREEVEDAKVTGDTAADSSAAVEPQLSTRAPSKLRPRPIAIVRSQK